MKKYKVISEINEYFNKDVGTKKFEEKLNTASQEGYVIERCEHRVDDSGYITFFAVMSKEEK